METTVIEEATVLAPEPKPASTEEKPHHHGHHHHHHHHHHHAHLDRYTGKGNDATGKRVVIGVDGSEHSNYACDWFFSHLWSPEDYVVLLNCPDLHDVVKSQWSGGKYVFDREVVNMKLKEGEDQVHGDLEKYKEKLVKQGAHGKVRAVSAKNAGDAILKTSEDEVCDLIVIGCRGRSTLRRTILGTVSDYIVHHAAVPVVVCRHKTSRRKSSAITPPNIEDLNINK